MHRPHATSRTAIALVVWAMLLLVAHSAAAPLITVNPPDTGEALCNPGMGWVFHHYDNSISGYGPPLGPGYDGSSFPGLTVAYLRLPWSYLEPEEGKFNWSVVDTPAQRYIAAGKKIAFRFTCFESGVKFATPQWVRDAGAKGYWWKDDVSWEPDYDDPVFLEKLDRFLAAAGARYDGNPQVAFIDVGTIGVWGEGHPLTKKYGLATIERHIDLHHEYFSGTLITAMDDWIHHYTEADVCKRGKLNLDITCDIPEKAYGQSFTMKLGMWIQGDASRPDGRLLPVGAEPDRRVAVGTLTVSQDGTPSFEPCDVSVDGQGDFRMRALDLRSQGRRWLIKTYWEILRDLPEGSSVFCHFERDGEIVFSGWPANTDTRPVDYARNLGFTLRDDSILVQGGARAYYNEWLATDFWPRLPVVLESGHYGGAKQDGTWGDGSRYLDAVEDYHASYVSIHAFPDNLLNENRDLIRRMNMRIGYRLSLVEASWPEQIPHGAEIPISSQWRNDGVAPCYEGGYPAFWLFNEREELVAVFVDEKLNVGELPVGAPGEAQAVASSRSFLPPLDLPSGKLELRVSVGDRHGTPEYALPLAGDDGHRRYAIGHITVLGEYDVRAAELGGNADEWVLPVTWNIHVPLPDGVTPFCHVDCEDEQMVFAATASAAGDLTKPGQVQGAIRVSVPEAYRGKWVTLKAGLWKPQDATRPWARMLPDRGENDRRVPLGRLSVSADGEAEFRVDVP